MPTKAELRNEIEALKRERAQLRLRAMLLESEKREAENVKKIDPNREPVIYTAPFNPDIRVLYSE